MAFNIFIFTIRSTHLQVPLARLLLPHLGHAALLRGVQAEGHQPAERVAGEHFEYCEYCEQEHGHSSVAGLSVYADLQNLIFIVSIHLLLGLNCKY